MGAEWPQTKGDQEPQMIGRGGRRILAKGEGWHGFTYVSVEVDLGVAGGPHGGLVGECDKPHVEGKDRRPE